MDRGRGEGEKEGWITGTWYIHEIIQVGLERHQAWLDHICIAGVH